MFRQRFGKYRSVRQECQKGHWHHSKAEAGKCDELRLQEKARAILHYETQKKVKLYLGDVYMGSMYVDFLLHHLNGTKEYLETKGSHLRNEQKFKRDWQILQEMNKHDPNIKFTLEIIR